MTEPMTTPSTSAADEAVSDPGATVSASSTSPTSSPTDAGRLAGRIEEPPRPGLTSRGKVRSTRVSAWWVGLILAAVVLILLLIFVAENSRQVAVRYLGFDGQVSLAIALLLSAVAGVLLVAIPGSARIMQLRRALRRNASRQGGHQTTTRKRR